MLVTRMRGTSGKVKKEVTLVESGKVTNVKVINELARSTEKNILIDGQNSP
jgi:ABC-type proline/glycine betaine transport system ATPase subunit